MAAEQSQFSRLPKKTLINISKELIDDNFPQGNPYDYDYDEHNKTLERIGKHFNISINDEDVQFFAKFLEINDDILSQIFETGDKSLSEELEIPVAKTYELQYSVWGSCTYDEYLAQTFDAYDKNWVDDSVRQQMNDGNFDLYDGRNRGETIYDNHDMSDFEFNNVIELSDESTGYNRVRESLQNRLVVENTSKVISSLDKKTLLKLKRIIESRLSSL
jgi:hypothetical protein